MAWIDEHGGKIWGAVITAGAGGFVALIRGVLTNSKKIAVMEESLKHLRDDMAEMKKHSGERSKQTTEILRLLKKGEK